MCDPAPQHELTPAKKTAWLTATFALLWLAGGAVFDLVAYDAQKAGRGATISQVLLQWDRAFPLTSWLVVLMLGALAGHLFLPRDPEVITSPMFDVVCLFAVIFSLGVIVGTEWLYQRP